MSAIPDLDALALEMKTAQDSMQQIDPFTSRYPDFDLSCAYAVGARIHELRIAEGARPVGRKIGFTNPDMWSRYGVSDPIWAYVYDTSVTWLQDLQSSYSIARFVEPKIEPEIIFHFCSDLSAPAELADVMHAIDWAAHGFEIVQSHFPDWQFQAPDTVADQGLHGALVIGPPQPLLELGSDPADVLASLSVDLLCNGDLVETGTGSNVLGNPLAAVAHLASVLNKQPGHTHIKAGEIISTGTITTAQTMHTGDIWQSRIRDIALSDLTVKFA